MKGVKVVLLFTFIVISVCSSCTSSHSYATTEESGHFGCDSYGDRLQISWLIHPTDTTLRLILSFTTFDTEANYDFVRIYDGSDSHAPLLGSFSGSVIPGPFTSSSNALYIVFTADQYVEGGGFYATWTSFTTTNGIGPCNSNQEIMLSGDDGEFGCDSYTNSLATSWKITGSPGERIVLSFDRFETERTYDVVRVYDGENDDAMLVGTYSGSDIPPPTTATSNVLFITFTTDYSLTSGGFSASWSSLVSFADPCYNSTSTILFPREGYLGCPYGYGNRVNSTWLISIIGNVIIQLDFLTLNTEENHDYVTVYDGTTSSSPILGRFSGIQSPNSIVSSGNRLLVRLETDGSGVANGFTATYQSVHALQPDGCSRSGTFILTDSEDSLGCNGYLNGVTEEWHLQAGSETEVINLTWHSFNTEANHDIVYIYDGNSTTSNLVLQASGTLLPDPVVSSGQYLLVKFVADTNGIQGDGFSAVYESIVHQGDESYSCESSNSYTLTEPTGVFGCDGYGNNVVVSFQIQVESGFLVLLNFNTFFTEALYDFVTVYDGPNDQASALGSWSGAFRPPEISSSSNYLFVVLTSDGGISRAGFTAEYSSFFTGSDAEACFESASHSLSTAAGTFGCTGYGSQVEITWGIVTDVRTTIDIDFTSFQTEQNYDVVRIYDGMDDASRLLAEYSGVVIPEPVHSSNNYLFVKFTSDASVQLDGFRAEYHAVQASAAIPYCAETIHRTYSAPSASFGCNGYANSIDPSWSITVASGQRITLTISSLNTEFTYDYIKIFDGTSSSDTLLGTFSGDTPPPAFTSTENSFYITFHSDSSVSSSYDGFIIEYVSFGSFGGSCDYSQTLELTDSAGTFGCHGYSSSVTVTWSIRSFGLIFINFDQIDTEPNYDTVSIYDGPDDSADLLATYSGTSASPLRSSGNALFVRFQSDSSINRNGFTANYVTLVH